MTEKEKMLAGELYDPAERVRTRLLIKELNDSREGEVEEHTRILNELISNAGAGLWLQPPFYCDFGSNIVKGERVFFNFNCVALDVMQVTIGSRTLLGPNVQVYTATHPIDHTVWSSGAESARPVAIGEEVWVRGSAVVCPDVTIGDRTILGAGSVVTRDIPSDVFAAGNPYRVISTLPPTEAHSSAV